MNLAPSNYLRDPSKAVVLEGKVEKQWFSIIGKKRQNKGMLAKLKIFDLIGKKYFVWFFLDSNNNDRIWLGEMAVFPLKTEEMIFAENWIDL